MYSPSSRPSTVGTAPRNPRSAARLTINAIAGPGDAEISSTATTNAGSETTTSIRRGWQG